MPTIYITGATNKPSGGVKVMNQISVLFKKHGYESFVVAADNSPHATFIDEPANILSINQYADQLDVDDITIDFWPDKKLFEIAQQKKNKTRVFWQHGASIPTGGTTVGDAVFRPGNPYTQHWNVSRACSDYFQQTYGLNMPVVHPFFDSITMKKFQERMNEKPRDGLLLLARRGQKYIPEIQKHFGRKNKMTIIHEPYHERFFFEALLSHKFFISIDDGIHRPTLIRRGKDLIKRLLSREYKTKLLHSNKWILSKNHLLGFPMPPVEAAQLGCVVIGFAMGGGLEWMNEKNCFLAEDCNKTSLLDQITKATSTSMNVLQNMKKQACEDTNIFTTKNTWRQLVQLLSL